VSFVCTMRGVGIVGKATHQLKVGLLFFRADRLPACRLPVATHNGLARIGALVQPRGRRCSSPWIRSWLPPLAAMEAAAAALAALA
jgi:hypothetical protein